MKKLLLVGLMLFGASSLQAKIQVGTYEVFRATEVSGAVSNFQVSTGSVYLYGYIVSSGNINSTFQYRNSSTTATSGSINSSVFVIPSTSVVYQIPTSQGNFVYIGDYLPEGFNITTTGTSHIRILWDWLHNIPRGQEKKGFRR